MSALPKHLLTAEEFAALPHEGLRLELIRGEIVAMPPTFDDHGEIALRLAVLLGHYVLAHKLGRMYAAETGFLIAQNPDTVRAPDLAFIEATRVPPRGLPGWVRVIPDLVAEVISSGDRPSEVAEKARMWLDAGVRLVWVLYPPRRIIEAYRPNQPVLVLHEGETLEGADVVPGFMVAVSEVFVV
jgi:Uma2 family endonuclease